MMDDRDQDFFQQAAEGASESVIVTASLLWLFVAVIAAAVLWRLLA